MTRTAEHHAPVLLRFLQLPLTRLVLLGGLLYVLMGVKNGFSAKYAAQPLLNLAAVAAMSALSLAVYMAFVRLIERRAVDELSLPGMGREFGIGLFGGASLYTVSVVILTMLGVYRIDGFNPVSFMLPAVALALGSGVIEELVFRGAVFRIVEESLGSWVSVVVSSLVFGLVHLANPASTLAGALFISVEAGLLLAAAYMFTRRLWLAMGFHIAWNFTQSGIFSGVVSGGAVHPGLIKASLQGPDLLTGGSFGLEASVVAGVVCTVAGVLLLRAAISRGQVVRYQKPNAQLRPLDTPDETAVTEPCNSSTTAKPKAPGGGVSTSV